MRLPNSSRSSFAAATPRRKAHHGGVWKIAYADFMTAMMAFFLVMWLVNASNTEMKASVASYFNPIKLSDSVIRKKGLRDVDGKANAEEAEGKAEKGKSKGKADSKSKSDAHKSDAQPLQPGEAVQARDRRESGSSTRADGCAVRSGWQRDERWSCR